MILKMPEFIVHEWRYAGRLHGCSAIQLLRQLTESWKRKIQALSSNSLENLWVLLNAYNWMYFACPPLTGSSTTCWEGRQPATLQQRPSMLCVLPSYRGSVWTWIKFRFSDLYLDLTMLQPFCKSSTILGWNLLWEALLYLSQNQNVWVRIGLLSLPTPCWNLKRFGFSLVFRPRQRDLCLATLLTQQATPNLFKDFLFPTD